MNILNGQTESVVSILQTHIRGIDGEIATLEMKRAKLKTALDCLGPAREQAKPVIVVEPEPPARKSPGGVPKGKNGLSIRKLAFRELARYGSLSRADLVRRICERTTAAKISAEVCVMRMKRLGEISERADGKLTIGAKQ